MKRTKKFLLGMGAAVLCLAAGDFVLDSWAFIRLVAHPYRADVVKEEKDDYLKKQFAPSQKNVWVNQRRVNFNADGFRGKELRKKQVRIAAVGDSVTFGWTASGDELTYPAILEEFLSPFDAEVVNAGVPRFNVMDVLALYLARIVPLKPQGVILLVGWNDIGYEFAPYRNETEETGIASVGASAMRAYSALRLIGESSQILMNHVKGADRILKEKEKAGDPIRWDRVDEYERILTALVSAIKANGSTPVLVTLPHFLHSSMSEKEKKLLLHHLLAWPDLSYQGWEGMVREVNGRIRKVASTAQVPLADCENKIGSEYFTDLNHLNDEGNRRLAQCVSEKIGTTLFSLRQG